LLPKIADLIVKQRMERRKFPEAKYPGKLLLPPSLFQLRVEIAPTSESYLPPGFQLLKRDPFANLLKPAPLPKPIEEDDVLGVSGDKGKGRKKIPQTETTSDKEGKGKAKKGAKTGKNSKTKKNNKKEESSEGSKKGSKSKKKTDVELDSEEETSEKKKKEEKGNNYQKG